MRTNDDREHRTRISRRLFVAAVGVHAIPAIVGSNAAADPVDGVIRVAATEPYRSDLERAITLDERTTLGHDIRVVSAGSNTSDRVGDDIDALVSGRPTPSTDDPPSEVDQFATVTDWAALDVPTDCWRECLRQSEVRSYWDGDDPVEMWSESDWDTISAITHTSRCESATRGDATIFDPVMLVYGTRAYQYAHGFGGLGHYRVTDDVLDRSVDAQIARRDGAVPLVRLGYVHMDRSVVDGDLLSFFKAYDRRKGSVGSFPITSSASDIMSKSPY